VGIDTARVAVHTPTAWNLWCAPDPSWAPSRTCHLYLCLCHDSDPPRCTRVPAWSSSWPPGSTLRDGCLDGVGEPPSLSTTTCGRSPPRAKVRFASFAVACGCRQYQPRTPHSRLAVGGLRSDCRKRIPYGTTL